MSICWVFSYCFINWIHPEVNTIFVFLTSAVLGNDGHTVDLVQIKDRNAVELWVNGELIFKCDIRDLDYGKYRQTSNIRHTKS